MKKQKYILPLLAFTPLVMNSQNHFTDGMKWRTQIYGTHEPEVATTIEVVTIEKTTDDNIFNLYRSYENHTSDRTLIASVKTEESKVYFNPIEGKSTEWYLLYDFSLKPGEGCFVYNPLTLSDESVPYKTYVKCVDIDEKSNEQWSILRLDEYTDNSCSNLIGNGLWISGLSSLNGILYNNRFGVDGFGSKLLDVSLNERILYASSQSGISEITDSSEPNVRVDGLDIYISVNDDTYGTIYSQSGMHIGNYKFSKTPTHIRLSDKGVYILKLENSSLKLLVP
ncbi:MAG: hypothetical protein K2L80_00835 [Muribaculaceae bacterium]|nr:hypothetical protein [Muribaculaceae bacterium]